MIRSTCYLFGLTAFCAAFAYAAGGLTPVVESVFPTSAPPNGNTTLTIMGRNFGPTSTPLIGGLPLMNRHLVNSTYMTGVTPAAGGTNVPIVVTGGDGSVSPPFTGFSFDKPVIFNITPINGPAYQPTTITIIGKNFGSSGKVFLGRNEIAIANYTDTRVMAKVGPGRGQELPVRVHDDFGQISDPIIGFSFRLPIISSIFPTNGTRLGGTVITIVGQDFGFFGNVTIGSIPAPILDYSNKQIIAETPPGSSDNPDIVVTPGQGDPGDPTNGFWRYKPCPAGYFDPQNNGQCRPCRPGTYSDQIGADSCLPCRPGTVQPHLGATECVPCEVGHYQDQLGQTACNECTPGSYAPTRGSPLCRPCPPGTASAAIAADSCLPCRPGSAQPESGQVECEKCEIGTFAAEQGNRACDPCPAGYVQPNVGQASCDPCNPGTFQPVEGGYQCHACAPGTFQPDLGQGQCMPCPLGSYQLEPGAATCRNCDEAPPELQVDFDGDGLIDVCDTDDDNDDVPDDRDRCRFTPLIAAVDPSGRSLGDTDRDCDTDLEDISNSTLGFTGPFRLPVDCVVSEFGPISQCSAACGGGTQCRRREVLQEPAFGGAPCPPLEECRACNTQPCPVDCVVGAWSDFSDCSERCGGGTQCRTRSVIQPPQFGGLACPALEECQACNTDPCR